MIKAIVFTAACPYEGSVPVETLYKALGENIPRYSGPLEGGPMDGRAYYRFCVDARTDIKGICVKHKYTYGNDYDLESENAYFTKFEVDVSKFNSNYQIESAYGKGVPYELVPYTSSVAQE